MKQRILFLLRLYVSLLLIFVTQKIVFLIACMGHADGAPFGSCLASLWHGLRLDSVMSCYLLIIPALVVLVSCFFRRFALRKVLMPYYIIVAIPMALIFFVDTVLYYYWGSKFDAAELFYASDPAEVLANIKLWIVILIFIVLFAVIFHYVRRLRHATTPQLDKLNSRWATLLVIPVFLLIFVGMRGSLSQSTANPSYAYFSRHAFCNHAALNPMFNFLHSLFKTEDLTKQFDLMPIDEAEATVAPCYATDDDIADTLLTMSRPDVLMIVWEGGGTQMVWRDSVAPNLIRYSKEGVFFSNCVANGFRTDRGVLSLLSGWVSLPTTSLMKMNDKCCRLPGMAESLNDAGYSSCFYYGGDAEFTNMRGYLYEVGFDHVKGMEDFPSSNSLGYWGSPDAYMLLPSVLNYQSNDTVPRFDVILTLSSHDPWEVPLNRFENDRLNAFCYTDSCIGVLLDSLRQTPEWDKLLVIIVPDHGVPHSSSQSMSDPAVAKIPLVMTGGAVRGHHEYDMLMNQSDIAATLFAQMGIGRDGFVMSRNVLSPGYKNMRQMALHSFKGGSNLFLGDTILRVECADVSITSYNDDPTSEQKHFLKAILQYIYQKTGEL